ncbi:MAG: hypothetical protein Q6373_011450 [Candidatus Sigynarchaeota archaeon]
MNLFTPAGAFLVLHFVGILFIVDLLILLQIVVIVIPLRVDAKRAISDAAG